MSSSSMKQLGLTLLHLAVWAYLGVLARGFLGQFFELGCSGQWGPCLEGKHFPGLFKSEINMSAIVTRPDGSHFWSDITV